jgi:uncharacterized protein
MATTDTSRAGRRRRRRGDGEPVLDSADVSSAEWHDDGKTGDPPRRTMPVAHILVVGIVALMFGALLNAPGIRKTALGQDVGWRRDLATFFADGLFDLSHAILLDRPREGLQDAIGRSGDDDVDLTSPSPTLPGTTLPPSTAPGEPPPEQPPESELPPKHAFSPQDQAALYVTGDSLSITPGESVINQALGTGVIGLLGPVDGHVATGLARPEIFNWPAYLTEVVNRDHPDAVVLTIGSNDDQTLTGEGGVGDFGSPEWIEEYRRRVGGLMDAITSSGETTLFWVGIPPMANTERFETRYSIINDIVRQEAEKRPRKVAFVDTVPVLSPFGGGYAEYLPRDDGSVIQVRATDGIHFTREGGDLIAAEVLKTMGKTFDLDSWRNAGSTTTSTTSTTKPKARAKDGG